MQMCIVSLIKQSNLGSSNLSPLNLNNVCEKDPLKAFSHWKTFFTRKIHQLHIQFFSTFWSLSTHSIKSSKLQVSTNSNEIEVSKEDHQCFLSLQNFSNVSSYCMYKTYCTGSWVRTALHSESFTHAVSINSQLSPRIHQSYMVQSL